MVSKGFQCISSHSYLSDGKQNEFLQTVSLNFSFVKDWCSSVSFKAAIQLQSVFQSIVLHFSCHSKQMHFSSARLCLSRSKDPLKANRNKLPGDISRHLVPYWYIMQLYGLQIYQSTTIRITDWYVISLYLESDSYIVLFSVCLSDIYIMISYTWLAYHFTLSLTGISCQLKIIDIPNVHMPYWRYHDVFCMADIWWCLKPQSYTALP